MALVLTKNNLGFLPSSDNLFCLHSVKLFENSKYSHKTAKQSDYKDDLIHIEGCIVSTALTQPRQRALLYPKVAKISGEILNRDLHCMEEISFFFHGSKKLQ